MRNIKYIGTKATEDAFFDRTQIIWTPGMIDTVLDEAVAAEMLRFAEFEDAGDAFAGAGVAVGALAITPTGMTVGGAALTAEQKAVARAGMGVYGTKYKFFASLPEGANYRSQKSLLAAPAWEASKVYGTGSVVQNGGNVYLCQSSFGAAAASGGPSGTGAAQITDGAVKWLYMGPAGSALADSSDAPVMTFAATHASTTRRYDPNVAADAAAFWCTGAAYGTVTPWGGGSAIGSSSANSSFSIDFCTDAPIISFSSHVNIGWASQTDAYAFNALVNGVQLLPVGGVQPGVNLTPGGVLLDFSSKPKKARRIRNYWSNRTFSGVSIDPKYRVWAPLNPNRYRLALEGDSTTRGAGPTNSNAGDMRAARLANMLGCDDVWNFSVGSTGFINAGGGSTVLTRAASVIAAAPDILYVAPINNDVGNDATYNSTTRKAAYTAYFNTILSALPNCIIICGGGYATGAANLTTTSASAWQVEADMASAIAAYNHPNVKFLPSISDPSGRWLYGDGHIGTTGNSTHGNSDLMIGDGTDTLHPNQRFLEYVMWREFNGIVGIMNSIN